jgi:hypothetical protein
MAKRFSLFLCILIFTCALVCAGGKPTPGPGPFKLATPSLATTDMRGNLRIWDLSNGQTTQTWSLKTTPYGNTVFADLDGDRTDELVAPAVCNRSTRKNTQYQIYLNVYQDGTGEKYPGFPGLWQTTYYSDTHSIFEPTASRGSVAKGNFDTDAADEVVLLTPSHLAIFNYDKTLDEINKVGRSLDPGWTGISVTVGKFVDDKQYIIATLYNPVNYSYRVVVYASDLVEVVFDQTLYDKLLIGPIQTGDTDGDDHVDSIWSAAAKRNDNSLYIQGWVLNESDGFDEKSLLVAGTGVIGPRLIAVGDLGGSSGDEIAIAYLGTPDGLTNRISIWSLSDLVSASTPPDPSTTDLIYAPSSIVISHMKIADVDGDGKNEVVTAGRGSTVPLTGETYLEVFTPVSESDLRLNSRWRRIGVKDEGEISGIAIGN